MKSVSELTDFYYKNLFPSLEELEKERRNLRYRIILVGLAFSFFTLFVYSFFHSSDDINPIIIFGFVYVALGGMIYRFLIKDYTSNFKQKIISPLIKAIDANLTYSSTTHLPQRLFEKSKLFSSPDRLSGNDYVQGSIDGINIQFSDLHAEKRTKNSKGQDNWSTIFRGLFIVSDFHKNFNGETIVLPDTAQSAFGDLIGSWLQSKNLFRGELVKMDNPEFEKEFVVYSNDQIESRYILSHSLMNKLYHFQKRSEHPLYVSFVGASIHMAIYYDKDLFEPSVFRSLLKYNIAIEYIKTMHLAIGVVQELKLNQKLWSKQ